MKGFFFIIGVFGIVVTFVPFVFGINTDKQSNKDVDELLRLHKELIEAHKAKDIDMLFEPESEQVITVNRGEVLLQTKNERITQFKQYLESTDFEEYRDLINPIVRVSKDGTLGWLIAQVRISGARIYEDGKAKNFESVWAWIELFEKKNGRWYRIGDVSNVRPDNL